MLQALARIALTSTVCILLMVLVARVRVSIPGGEERGRVSAAKIQTVGDIYEGIEVRQEFLAAGTRIRSLELQLATYGRANKGKFTLRVERFVNGHWEELAQRTMSKRVLQDCAWHLFGFAPALRVKYGQRIALTVTADADVANGITWWTSPEVEEEGHPLSFNGELRPGHAHFSVQYEPVAGKAGFAKMRPRLWQRLTVFLDPLGQAMLAGGFLFALFGLVHLSMHTPRPQSSSLTGGDVGAAAGLIDCLRARHLGSGLRAIIELVRKLKQRRWHRQSAERGSFVLAGLCVLALVIYWLARA